MVCLPERGGEEWGQSGMPPSLELPSPRRRRRQRSSRPRASGGFSFPCCLAREDSRTGTSGGLVVSALTLDSRWMHIGRWIPGLKARGALTEARHRISVHTCGSYRYPNVMHEVVGRSMDEVLIFKPPNVDLPPDSSKSPKFAPSNRSEERRVGKECSW